MFAFLTKEVELKKDYDIVYIFNNEKLYNKLKYKFSCVNLSKDGNIKDINFEKVFNKDLKLYQILDIQKTAYFYLRKRRMIKVRKDYNLKLVYELEKENKFEDAIRLLVDINTELAYEIIYMSIESDFIQINKKFIEMIFNYVNSLYYAYAMKFSYNEKIEVFKFTLFLNVMNYYRFNKFDLNKNSFKRGYLKILSRLFIEQIHRRELV